jgi:hypothetical protein
MRTSITQKAIDSWLSDYAPHAYAYIHIFNFREGDKIGRKLPGPQFGTLSWHMDIIQGWRTAR